MQSQFPEWLAVEKAAGRGGIRLPAAIQRGVAWSLPLSIPLDVSDDAFKASLRLAPDAAGATVEDLAVTVGSYADGATLVTLSLTKTETALAGAGDGDGDGVAELLCTVLHTPQGGTQVPFLSMSIPITGKITDAD